MQSRLIDVNTSAIKRRNEVSAGLDSQNYDKVFGALYSLNALLPEFHEDDGRQKYRITISDILYRQFTKPETKITCKICTEVTNFDKIKVFEMIPPMFEGIMVSNKPSKVWVCPKCHIDNKLKECDMVETSLREPYFLRVISKPPLRRDGLHDRSSYHRKVVQWAWTFMQEWEASMAQFRDDNWQKTDELFATEEIEGGEENDT